MNIKFPLLSLVFLLILTCCTRGNSQDQTDTPDEASAATEKERTIYIPFSKLREVFEKEGRGVFLPYDQFQALWKAAQENRLQPNLPAKSPVDAIISSAFNEATVQRDVVQVEATLSIELIKKGWIQVPIRLSEAAIQSATIDGEVARVTLAPEGGYQLLVEHKADESKTVELKLVYSRAFEKSPGRNSVAFDAPQAPVNRWRIRISQSGVKVNVQPMIAASEVADEDMAGASEAEPIANTPKPKDETVLLAFVGAAPRVAIDWTPKSEGATGMTALTAVQVQQEMYVTEGAVRTRATLQYEISRGELSQLSIEVPSDQKVVNVFDANVRKWVVVKDGDLQRIDVELFEPARTSQNLLIELETFTEGEAAKIITAPRIRVMEVGRQQGTLVVSIDPALRAEATTRTGLLQVDASDLPPGLAGQTWAFSYRYAALPFELGISAEKIQPRITVTQLIESYLEPEQWTVDLLALYNIEEAGIFQLEFAVPTGFEVLQVRGREVTAATPAAVDSYHLDGDNKERLIVNLARKAIGKVALSIQLQRKLSDANLLTPTGTTSALSLVVPQVKQANVTRATGHMIIHAPESLRVNPTSTAGLRAISFSEVYQELASIRENRFSSTRPALAFAFSDQVAQLDFSAERRKSFVTARQRLVARLDSGVARYETMIFYEILYSGVKSLRLDVPADLAAELRNTSSGIREAPLDPAPADVAEGYVAWSLSGESELIGKHVVQFTWERKLEQLEVGKSLNVDVPHLKPMAVDRAWGQIVVTKTESLDVQPAVEPTGLRSIDPLHDLMADAAVPDAARAFEFYDDWTLKLTATRYQLEEVKRTSIERALVRVVVTRSDQQGIQALYRLRSARQRLALRLPADAEFDSQPARINGQPVALERGDQGQLFIPLIGQDPDTSFTLELRYSAPGSYKQVIVPEFPEDPAVQKVFVAAFLPAELAVIGSAGPWTEEFAWLNHGSFQWVPQPTHSDDELINWVREGMPPSPMSAFQTDGTMYLFSALRPEPPPNGTLALYAINDKWLAGLIFLPLAIIGLVLLRKPLRAKVIAIAAILVVIIACGIFAPTFAQQLLNAPMYAGLAMVGVLWTAWYVIRAARSIPRKQEMFQPLSPIATETEATPKIEPSSDAGVQGGSQNE